MATGQIPNIEGQQVTSQANIKQVLSSFNKIAEMCFDDCVHDFTTRKVLESESLCAKNCMGKYLAMSQRITERFVEYHELNASVAGLTPH